MLLKRMVKPLSTERRAEVLEQLSQASSPSFDFFLLVILSSSIATFGLITDSPAVVIGAMLVAPLMSPILGLSLASVAGEQQMFERAILALTRGILLTIFLSSVISWLAQALPFDVFQILPREILSRTRPTPFDLGIALAGGAAAAYALAQPHMSAALPGVAIATALVPPLCTVGIGISLKRPDIALGALLLFATNLVTISFAGILTFALLGFRPLFRAEKSLGIPRHLFVSFTLVLLVTFPLVGLTMNFVDQSRQERALQDLKREAFSAVATEVSALPDVQLAEVNTTLEDSTLNLLITIRSSRQLSYREVVDLQEAIAARLQRTVAIQLIDVPMIQLDPKLPPTLTSTPTPGPSSTPTVAPTRTSTRVPPTNTPTVTPTPTETSTPTMTFTPTPVLAYIANTGGAGIYLRDAPGGKIMGTLPEGAPVQILYRRETINEVEWIEIRDVLGRTGWILSQFLIIKP